VTITILFCLVIRGLNSQVVQVDDIFDYIGIEDVEIRQENELAQHLTRAICKPENINKYLKDIKNMRKVTLNTLPTSQEIMNLLSIVKHLKMCPVSEDQETINKFINIFTKFFEGMNIGQAILKGEQGEGERGMIQKDNKKKLTVNVTRGKSREMLSFLKSLILELVDERLPALIVSQISGSESGLGFDMATSIAFRNSIIEKLQTFNQKRLEEYLLMIKSQNWFKSFKDEIYEPLKYNDQYSKRIETTIKAITEKK